MGFVGSVGLEIWPWCAGAELPISSVETKSCSKPILWMLPRTMASPRPIKAQALASEMSR